MKSQSNFSKSHISEYNYGIERKRARASWYASKPESSFITEIIDGHRILIDFELNVVLEDGERGEYCAGRHAGRFSATTTLLRE